MFKNFLKINKNFPIILFIAVFLMAPFSNADASVIGKSLEWLFGGNRDTGLNYGLTGWWTLDGKNLVNNVADSSGNNKTIFLQNVATSSAKIPGVLGQALKLDGSNDYIDLKTTTLAYNVTASYSIWFYPKLTNGKAAIFAHDTNTFLTFSGLMCGGLWLDGTTLKGELYDNTSYRTVSTTISANKWNHAVFIKNMSTGYISLYVNGNYVNQTTFSTSGLGYIGASNYCTNNLKIGYTATSNASGPINYFNGHVDDIRLYNREISASEVKQIYNQGVSETSTSVSGLSSDKMLGWWTFDGAYLKNNVTDKSGKNKNGYFSGITSTSSAILSGKFGQALKFNGSNQYIETNQKLLSNGGNYTISLWARNYSNTNMMGLISESVNSFHMNFFIMAGSTSNYLVMGIRGSSGMEYQFAPSAGTFPLNKWNHVVMVINHDTDRVYGYTNGVKVIDFAITSMTSLGSPTFRIGYGYGGFGGNFSNYFHGAIDDVRLFNYAMSSTEVKHLYNQSAPEIGSTPPGLPSTGLNSGLVGWWTLNGNKINRTTGAVSDSSGNNITGTTTNMSTSTAPAPGILGQSLYFDGIDDYVNLGQSSNTIFNGSNDFSLSLWTNLKQHSSWTSPFGKIDSLNPGGKGLYFGTYSNAKRWMASLRDGTNSVGSYGSVDFKYNTWYHLVAVYSASNKNMKFYVNAILTSDHTNENLGDATNARNMSIGAGRPGVYQYNGKVDDIRLYNRILSVSEITQLYNQGK